MSIYRRKYILEILKKIVELLTLREHSYHLDQIEQNLNLIYTSLKRNITELNVAQITTKLFS